MATRTDNDTWDLATSVGATATMVAAARARATKAGVIDDRFAEPLVRAVGVDFFTRWATGELDPADVDDPAAPWGVQQMTDAMAARTRYFDAFFADAAAAGIRQAVIVASGLDTRSYRMAWPADMTVFEIDQPQVVGFKAATLADLGAEPAADLRLVPIDLRQDWPAALLRAGFHAQLPTVWSAEGLLPFLPPGAQDRMLDTITALSADGSRLATEMFMDATQLGQERAEDMMRGMNQRWRAHGLDLEIWDLSYQGQRHDVATYLQPRGWSSEGTTMVELLAANGLPTASQDSEEADFANNRYYTSTRRKLANKQMSNQPRPEGPSS
jgi:methyltransferase (TIGR00027 family)